MNESWIRDCVQFTEKNKRLSEALCVIRGYEVTRRYTDAELSEELAEVAIALVEVRAINCGRTQD